MSVERIHAKPKNVTYASSEENIYGHGRSTHI